MEGVHYFDVFSRTRPHRPVRPGGPVGHVIEIVWMISVWSVVQPCRHDSPNIAAVAVSATIVPLSTAQRLKPAAAARKAGSSGSCDSLSSPSSPDQETPVSSSPGASGAGSQGRLKGQAQRFVRRYRPPMLVTLGGREDVHDPQRQKDWGG
ncbi:hypothetical protein DPEC_G00338450 [Dallia pectoralis]|uniref:Uncharacterized protein n=1 Tax=Dallia pectoralis TaxID=75939 RepID=A0ACC2F4Y2_DALPE|nr:hypothetical protein DPEC_G00338450 [Dallia pectoralis]